MRFWSFSPQYLDRPGLVGMWKEACQAATIIDNVVVGKSCGYDKHSALQRFLSYNKSAEAFSLFMHTIKIEADKRGYNFNAGYIRYPRHLFPNNYFIGLHPVAILPVTTGQVDYEWQFYLSKVKTRSPELYNELISKVEIPVINDIFYIVGGDIEPWERVKEF